MRHILLFLPHAGCLLLAVALICAPGNAAAQDGGGLLGSIFQNHAVFQRDVPVSIWGEARAGDTVVIEMAGASATATADDMGRWSAELPAMRAGGPHVLLVTTSSGASSTAEDILIGDVFLCSGQSNMVLPVSRTLNAPFEAMRANDSGIRMVTIPNVSSPVVRGEYDYRLQWEVASPETVPDWSATCYYFARDLRKGPLEETPVGLITAAWGGSGIRPWMNAAALRSVGGYDDSLDMLQMYTKDESAAQVAFGRVWEAWWEERSGDSGMNAPWQPGVGREWPAAPEGLGDWTAWDGLNGFTGMVWFRTVVDLAAEQASADATLVLGGVDEVDETWINGHVVGNTFGYGTERVYTIPAELLREGPNVIVTNVLNTYAAGGLTGDHSVRALHLADGGRIPLADWQYDPVRGGDGYPPRAPWEAVAGLSTIHNGMVAPLRDYGLRGVVWYQGESDTGGSTRYADLLRALIAQWRGQFGTTDPPLPALVVQLPNYGSWPAQPGESGWAEIRQAQCMAVVDDPFAAVVVTLDVGDPHDLHPANKQAVGRRLARAATGMIYGDGGSPSGPMPVSAEWEDRNVVVTFGGATVGLVAYGGASPLGFEVCGDDTGSCRYADARVEGLQVRVLANGDSAITRIRYAWADSPIVTLFDAAGLPVGSFDLAIASR